MEQNVSMKINELPSPTWNWLKVNETPIKWSNKIEPCEIAAEGDAVSTETEQLSDIETGAGREADAIFATENTAKYQILADNAGKPVEEVEKDTDRDNWLSADEAKEYGLIDEVIKDR